MNLSPSDWQAIQLTLTLCTYTTLILLVIATPLAWWLAQRSSPLRSVAQAVVAMPLVLPPTVLGFYLLIALGPRGWIGGGLEALGFHHLAFSFTGILIGSVIYSLPFAVQPLHEAFRAVGRKPVEVAATLGAGPVDRFFTVVMPQARGGFIMAAVLSFAHTIGEFGVILMLGGSIPGETRVVSIAIYDHAEAMNFGAAHGLSALLLVFSFTVLLIVYAVQRRFDGVRP